MSEVRLSLDEVGRVAIVHDWLPVYAGAERVLEQMLHVLPQADVFSLIDFLPDDQRAFLGGRKVTTSFIQRLPFARKRYRNYLPFTPIAIEQFDLTEYDLVLSSSYVVAKGVLTHARQLHVSYVHSPIRYAWDLYHEYLREGGIERGLRSLIARSILHYMRLFDVSSSHRVDLFVANSGYVAQRIAKTYRREARVIYPPVDVEAFDLLEEKDDFYLTMSRLVPYKRIDLIVSAFAGMPDKKLVVIGDGPEAKKIARLASDNVELMGYQTFDVVRDRMRRARAFLFAGEEDFGIVPVEAMACGTPVIAYGAGGALETVKSGVSGLFFHEQTETSVQAAVRRFEAERARFIPSEIRAHAESFSAIRFRRELSSLLRGALAEHRQTQPTAPILGEFAPLPGDR